MNCTVMMILTDTDARLGEMRRPGGRQSGQYYGIVSFFSMLSLSCVCKFPRLEIGITRIFSPCFNSLLLSFLFIFKSAVAAEPRSRESENIANKKITNLSSSNDPRALQLTNETLEFPRVPICKWATVSNWFYPEYEDSTTWREFFEMVDDAEELSGDVTRPGVAEALFREAVHRFPQVR